MESSLKFSLIVATLGRKEEVEVLFNSLSKQKYEEFEVILADQNKNCLLDDIVKKYHDIFIIKHIHVNKCGLSYARNVALNYADGDIVGFPDDDCWYNENTLLDVSKKFLNSDMTGITIRAISEKGLPLQSRELCENEKLDRANIWRGGISISIFLKKSVLININGFDERLGAGSGTKYGSGEETDLLYRALDIGANIRHYQSIEVYHPAKIELDYDALYSRYYKYACGVGYVLSKNHASVKEKMIAVIRPLAGCMIAIFTLNYKLAHARWGSFKGKICGMYEWG